MARARCTGDLASHVPANFFESIVRPAFTGTNGIVCMLPETRSVREVFASYYAEEYARPQATSPITHHSNLMPAALTTLPILVISDFIVAASSSGELAITSVLAFKNFSLMSGRLRTRTIS